MRRRALPSSPLEEDPSPEGLGLCLSGDEQLSDPRWAASRQILMVYLRNSLREKGWAFIGSPVEYSYLGVTPMP